MNDLYGVLIIYDRLHTFKLSIIATCHKNAFATSARKVYNVKVTCKRTE